jgi:hypothetical protein
LGGARHAQGPRAARAGELVSETHRDGSAKRRLAEHASTARACRGWATRESLALPYESYQLALTTGIVAQISAESLALSGTAFDPALLLSEGKYVQRDTNYWTASGRLIFDATRFYLPVEAIDPFGEHSFVTYDSFAVLITGTRDPLFNTTSAENDYRVLAPVQVTDPNLNRAAVAFDALGCRNDRRGGRGGAGIARWWRGPRGRGRSISRSQVPIQVGRVPTWLHGRGLSFEP